MDQIEAISLRLRYEAFSKYASAISKCKEISDLALVLVKHMKYLMPFNFGRVLIYNDSYYYSMLYNGTKIKFESGTEFKLRGLETSAVDKNITQLRGRNEIDFDLLKETFEGLDVDCDSLEQICVVPLFDLVVYKALFGFASKRNQIISQADNQFSKLILDLFVTKFSEIKLSIDTKKQNEIIAENFDVISAKNQEIEQILVNQEDLIKRRTQQLEARNLALEEYSWITSHEIRRPLSNILGLVQLAYHDINDKESLSYVIGLLDQSANELDAELKRANEILANRN